MRDFGEILAENRKKKGYSQSDLVDLLSQEGIQVTTKAISKWETNAREPALHVFLTLCQLLDIEDIYESFFGENPYNIMSGLNEEGRNKSVSYTHLDVYKRQLHGRIRIIKSCIYGYLHFSAYFFWCRIVLFCNLLINIFFSHLPALQFQRIIYSSLELLYHDYHYEKRFFHKRIHKKE